MADVKLARQLTEPVTRLRQRQTAPLILELDLTEGIGEGPVTDPLTAIMSRRRARLPDVIEGLRRAQGDDRVRALVVKVGGGRIGLAPSAARASLARASAAGPSAARASAAGPSGRMARPLWASRTISSCSRTAAPGRSRHQPSGREPITLATSTTIVTCCPPIPISSAP